jgi:hypothetical protein
MTTVWLLPGVGKLKPHLMLKKPTFNIEQVTQLTVITKKFMQPACIDF